MLRTRRGIPISLAVLYIELATQVGLMARGVPFPGHFLVKVRMPQGEVVIDPFTGQSLSREDLERAARALQAPQGLTGDFEVPLGLFLQAAPPREIVARMLRNLKEIHRSARRLAALAGGAGAPGAAAARRRREERRDRGLALAELGNAAAAAEDLEHYVACVPKAEDRVAIEQRVAELRAAGRPRLH